MSRTTLLIAVCATLLAGPGCESKKKPTAKKTATSAVTASAATSASAKAAGSQKAAAKPAKAKTESAAAEGIVKYMPGDCAKGRLYFNVKGLLAGTGDHLAKLEENLLKMADDENLKKVLNTLKEGGFEPLKGINEVAVCLDDKAEPTIALGLDLGKVKDPLALFSKVVEDSGNKKPQQAEQDGIKLLENLQGNEGAIAVVAKNIVVATQSKAKLMSVAKGGDGAAGFADATKHLVYASGQVDPDTKVKATISEKAPNLAYNIVVELSGEAAKMLEKPDEMNKEMDKQKGDTAKMLEGTPFKAAAEHLKGIAVKIDGNKVTITGTLPKSLIGELIKAGGDSKPEDIMKVMPR